MSTWLKLRTDVAKDLLRHQFATFKVYLKTVHVFRRCGVYIVAATKKCWTMSIFVHRFVVLLCAEMMV